MENWQAFRESRLGVLFRYPAITPAGHVVQKNESSLGDAYRVHLLSPDSPEIYFEITNYRGLSAQQAYERHGQDLRMRLDDVSITPLTACRWRGHSAFEYAFQWDQSRRTVLLIERKAGTLRILYDSRSSLNEQILATLDWMDPTRD